MGRNKPQPQMLMSAVRQKHRRSPLLRRLRQQQAVAKLGEMALVASDLDLLFSEALDLIAQNLDVELCKVLEILPGGKELLLRAGIGWQEGLVGRAKFGAERESQAGYTLLSDEPVIVTDTRLETRFSGPQLLVDHGVVSGISVVIQGREQPFGVLGAHTTRRRKFTGHDAQFLTSMANILAFTAERMRDHDAIRVSRDQLSVILDGISEGVSVQDPSGELIYVNQKAAEILGYPSVEAVLQTPVREITSRFEVLDEEGREFPIENLPGRQAMQGLRNVSATICFKIKETGQRFWSIVSAEPIFNSAGQVVMVVNFFRDVSELKKREQMQRFLAEAGTLLASSLDFRRTLKTVARLSVTNLADWCTVHILENEEIRSLAVAHVDPEKVRFAEELQQRYPPSWNVSSPFTRVLRTGQPEFIPKISDKMLAASARDPEHLHILRELELSAAIFMPLVAHGDISGVITFVWSGEGNCYSKEDAVVVEELARRASLAIDNARLYRQARALNEELEAQVGKRTEQLQRLISKLKNEIAERKKSNEELERSQKMLEALFESAPDALVLVDEAGKIVRLNAQAEKIFGYSRSELLGQGIEMLLPMRHRQRHIHHRESFYRRMEVRAMGAGLDLTAIRKGGEEFPVDVMLSPIQLEEGTLVISAVRDITEQTQLQNELSELNRKLWENVEAERLFLSQELHDGPIQELYGISYSLSALGRQDGSGPVSETQTALADVIQTLRDICVDLRPPTLRSFGLEKAIRSHLTRLEESHPGLGIQADLMSDRLELPENVRLALYRVYQHAVNNVIRHSQAERLSIRFAYDSEQIILEIEDDGQGFRLPEKWIELAQKGHLGLVGTAERVASVGGTLEIDSAPGEGTRIRVKVPRNRDDTTRVAGRFPSAYTRP